ncbi:hypothetical protein ACIRYZ_18090 [Kitasatospora sp. NPDC101155]|uniref:hypothetical protein n=1 Tax=Kitasatospora sp. NPDC101155 TaxID=3364097 RepID=UPI0037F28F71
MKLHRTPSAPHSPRLCEVGTAPTTERFQVVIYLAKTSPAFPELEMRSCEEYALTHNWDVTLTVVDDETEKPLEQRPLLLAALQTIKDKGAEAILIPSKTAVSPIDGEFDEFASQVEKAGGFVQVARRWSTRYGIIPADDGASYPVWVIRDRDTSRLVKALPPGPEPLRFYSYDRAERWVRANEQPHPAPEVT